MECIFIFVLNILESWGSQPWEGKRSSTWSSSGWGIIRAPHVLAPTTPLPRTRPCLSSPPRAPDGLLSLPRSGLVRGDYAMTSTMTFLDLIGAHFHLVAGGKSAHGNRQTPVEVRRRPPGARAPSGPAAGAPLVVYCADPQHEYRGEELDAHLRRGRREAGV